MAAEPERAWVCHGDLRSGSSPVDDQERAKQFWTGPLGFTATRDETNGGERWVDVQQTHQELTARGVRFHTPPVEMHFGWWALIEDDCGTRYALGQWDAG